MKYLIRSLKQLLYFVLIFVVCVAIVLLLNHQPISAVPLMFQEGALLPICLIFVFFAAIYPLVGYRKSHIEMDDAALWPDYRDAIMEAMKNAGYSLKSESDTTLKFRCDSTGVRIARKGEDAITFERDAADPARVSVDGPARDTLRFVGDVYYIYRRNHPQDQEEQQ